MKKLAVMLLTLALVIGLAIPMAIPVAAGATHTINLESDDVTTETAGWTSSNPSSDPLNETNYSGGAWSIATDIASPHSNWYDETLVSPAEWISSEDPRAGSAGEEQWRLFREAFTIPAGAVNISGSLYMAADNDVIAYLNGTGTVIHEIEDVYASTGSGTWHFDSWQGSYSFTPVVGSNTLYFVLRNWSGGSANPTGLLYAAVVEYDIASIEVTKEANSTTVKEGDTITYTYEVHNDGDVPLGAPTVTDSLGITVSPVLKLDGVHNVGDDNDDGTFDPCETWVFTAEYTVEWFYDCYTIENTATASAWYDIDVFEATDESNRVVVNIERNPAIEVRKSGPTDAYFQSVNALYTYEVENVGDCGLLSVLLADDMTSPAYVSGDDGDDDKMIPGEVWVYEATEPLVCECETVTCFTNKATVTAEDIKGEPVEDEACWTVLVFQWLPRTIGFWGNFDNHIGATDIAELLIRVNDQSTYFGPGDPGPSANGVIRTLLDPVKGKMTVDKATDLLEKQLLAAWLSVKSYEGATDGDGSTYGDLNWAMDPNATVYINGTADGTVIELLYRIENAIGTMDKDGLLLAKDILEDLNSAESNSYAMFVPTHFDADACPLLLENKNPSDWSIVVDSTYGKLFYNAAGDEFEYIFCGCGLSAGTDYSLIYYADPWPGNGLTNSTGALIATKTADGCGSIFVAGSIDLGTDLPNADDDNYSSPCQCDPCPGAKIWLVPSSDYDAGTCAMTAWNPTAYLYEFNSITYDDTDAP